MSTAEDKAAINRSEVAAIRAIIQSTFDAEGAPVSLETTRATYDSWGLAYPLPAGSTCDLITLGGVPADKIVVSGSHADTALLYLHGGGYGIGSAKSHRHFVGQLCQASGLVGYNVDYRLAPEVVFPGAVDDALAAYRGLLDQGIAPDKIIISGDSAGGGLTIACALAIKAAGLSQPAGLFAISPWALLTQEGESYDAKADVDFICTKDALQGWADAYLAGTDPKTPLASPLLGDLKGLAPLLIHVGSEEVLLSDSIGLAQKAGLSNVDVNLLIAAEMPHVYHYMWPHLSAARRDIIDAAAWIRAKVG